MHGPVDNGLLLRAAFGVCRPKLQLVAKIHEEKPILMVDNDVKLFDASKSNAFTKFKDISENIAFSRIKKFYIVVYH